MRHYYINIAHAKHAANGHFAGNYIRRRKGRASSFDFWHFLSIASLSHAISSFTDYDFFAVDFK